MKNKPKNNTICLVANSEGPHQNWRLGEDGEGVATPPPPPVILKQIREASLLEIVTRIVKRDN